MSHTRRLMRYPSVCDRQKRSRHQAITTARCAAREASTYLPQQRSSSRLQQAWLGQLHSAGCRGRRCCGRLRWRDLILQVQTGVLAQPLPAAHPVEEDAEEKALVILWMGWDGMRGDGMGWVHCMPDFDREVRQGLNHSSPPHNSATPPLSNALIAATPCRPPSRPYRRLKMPPLAPTFPSPPLPSSPLPTSASWSNQSQELSHGLHSAVPPEDTSHAHILFHAPHSPPLSSPLPSLPHPPLSLFVHPAALPQEAGLICALTRNCLRGSASRCTREHREESSSTRCSRSCAFTDAPKKSRMAPCRREGGGGRGR